MCLRNFFKEESLDIFVNMPEDNQSFNYTHSVYEKQKGLQYPAEVPVLAHKTTSIIMLIRLCANPNPKLHSLRCSNRLRLCGLQMTH